MDSLWAHAFMGCAMVSCLLCLQVTMECIINIIYTEPLNNYEIVRCVCVWLWECACVVACVCGAGKEFVEVRLCLSPALFIEATLVAVVATPLLPSAASIVDGIFRRCKRYAAAFQEQATPGGTCSSQKRSRIEKMKKNRILILPIKI